MYSPSIMHARVLRLRDHGALIERPHHASPPSASAWLSGVLALSRAAFGDDEARLPGRRLVLRDSRADPDHGLLCELFEPRVVGVQPGAGLRLRGFERVWAHSPTGQRYAAGALQEWLLVEMRS